MRPSNHSNIRHLSEQASEPKSCKQLPRSSNTQGIRCLSGQEYALCIWEMPKAGNLALGQGAQQLVADARADRLAICVRFHRFSWFVAFSADPSTHRGALGRQINNARTIISIVRKIRFLKASDGASIHRACLTSGG